MKLSEKLSLYLYRLGYHIQDDFRKLLGQVAQLEDELAEHDAYYRKVVDEECAMTYAPFLDIREANEHIKLLESQNAALLEALDGMLAIHTEEMRDAGFVPPVCECKLCTSARETIRNA